MTISRTATRETAEKIIELLGHGLTSGIGKPIPGQMCVEAAVCYAMGMEHSDDPVCVSPAIRAFKIRLNDGTWSNNTARAEGMKRLAIAQLNSAGAVNDRVFVQRLVDLVICKIVPFALRASARVHSNQKHKNALETAANYCETEGTRKSALKAKIVAISAAAEVADAAYAACAAYAAVAASASDAVRAAVAVISAAAEVAYAAYAACAAADVAANSAKAAYDVADTVAYAAAVAARAAYAVSAAARDKYLAFIAEEVVQILIELKAPGIEWLDLVPIQKGEAA